MGKNSTLCYRGDAEQSSNIGDLSNTDSILNRDTHGNGNTENNANANTNANTNAICHGAINLSRTGGNRAIILHGVTSHCVNRQSVDNANCNTDGCCSN